MIHQEAIVEGLDHEPSDEEIKEAVEKLHDSGPGDSGLCAQAWKCLLKSEETFEVLKQIILLFLATGDVPTEWETGLLKILPKKGDLSDPGNHRGIMLLEVA